MLRKILQYTVFIKNGLKRNKMNNYKIDLMIMKSMFFIVIALIVISLFIFQDASSQDRKITIYPTYPGSGVRDYSKPGMVIDGNKIYKTYPGTDIRDYTQPGYAIRRENVSWPDNDLQIISKPKSKSVIVLPTYPGLDVIDYSKPGMKVNTLEDYNRYNYEPTKNDYEKIEF